MTFKAIIFDLGGVVLTNGTEATLQTLQNDYDISREEGMKFLRGEMSDLLRINRINPKQFWDYVENLLPKSLSAKDLRKIWYGNYKPREDILELADDLKHSYKVGLLGGGIEERIDYLRHNYDYERHFDPVLYSFEKRINKDNPVLWRIMMNRLGMLPNECLNIDDLSKFISTARGEGIETIVFKDVENLKKDLKSYDIKF